MNRNQAVGFTLIPKDFEVDEDFDALSDNELLELDSQGFVFPRTLRHETREVRT